MFPAGLWIKTTDLFDRKPESPTSRQLHFPYNLSLNLKLPQTNIRRDKSELSCCCFNQTRGHAVTFISSLSPLWERFLMPGRQNTVPWSHNLPCSCSSGSLFNKSITLSSAQSNWRYPHVTRTATSPLGKYLFFCLFVNEFKAEFPLLARCHFVLPFCKDFDV